MPRRETGDRDETIILLQQLLAIELWRGGLSQTEIRARLGLNMNALNRILKGVSRQVQVDQRFGAKGQK